jgi:glycosyltransferase involved in cell wall biosynthesis
LLHTPYSGIDLSKKDDVEFRQKLIKMDTETLKSYKKVYTNSKNTAQRLKKFNHIDSTPLYHPPKLAGKYFNRNPGNYILSVGRLDPLKRIDILIRCLRFCDSRIRCKIAGIGPELKSLKKIAEEYGVSDRIDFLGFVSDEELLELYAESAFVFFAPKDEDYGYITLEAFLSKKAVLTAQDAGGPLEFVENGINGIVINSPDDREVAKHVQSLFFDKERCRSYGINGYQKVKDICWDDVINALVGRD